MLPRTLSHQQPEVRYIEPNTELDNFGNMDAFDCAAFVYSVTTDSIRLAIGSAQCAEFSYVYMLQRHKERGE